jgi:hypothetical protein
MSGASMETVNDLWAPWLNEHVRLRQVNHCTNYIVRALYNGFRSASGGASSRSSIVETSRNYNPRHLLRPSMLEKVPSVVTTPATDGQFIGIDHLCFRDCISRR